MKSENKGKITAKETIGVLFFGGLLWYGLTGLSTHESVGVAAFNVVLGFIGLTSTILESILRLNREKDD
jgi:hypothetical protein